MSGGDAEPEGLPDAKAAASPQADAWAGLRTATPARIGLGRRGDAIPLAEVLAFQLAHAKARDAVHAALDAGAIAAALAPRPVIHVRSLAPDRTTYLRRPDLGRALDPETGAALDAAGGPFDLAFVIADGLSATATAAHAVPLLRACLSRLEGLTVAPIVVASQARVALGDPVGERLGARLCAVLIGERPGLSVSDSLGVYLTYDPRPGRRDSERNCISNVHDNGGLTYARAADLLAWLAREALARGVTGIGLKDEAIAQALDRTGTPGRPGP